MVRISPETRIKINPQIKEWIISHSPKEKWDFDSIDNLEDQFVEIVRITGYIDLFDLNYRFNKTKRK